MQITFNIKFILDQTNLFKGIVVNRTFQPINGSVTASLTSIYLVIFHTLICKNIRLYYFHNIN